MASATERVDPLMQISTSKRYDNGDADLVEHGQIGSERFEDFDRVGRARPEHSKAA
jgi:hypothetical protein